MDTLPVFNIPFDKEAYDLVDDEEQKVFTQSKDDRTKLEKLLQSYIGADCWYITINNNELVYNGDIKDKPVKDADSFIPAFLYDSIRDYTYDNINKLLDMFVESGRSNTLDIYMGYDWFKLSVKYEPSDSKFTLEYYKNSSTDEHIQRRKFLLAKSELEKAEELKI